MRIKTLCHGALGIKTQLVEVAVTNDIPNVTPGKLARLTIFLKHDTTYGTYVHTLKKKRHIHSHLGFMYMSGLCMTSITLIF